MNYKSLILIIIFFILLTQLPGQGYTPPQPRMPNNVVKDFIQMHQVYPDEAIRNHEEGVFIVTFKTDKKGKVYDTEVEKSVSDLVDSTAMNLFRMILWEPAKYLGRAVNGESEFKIKYNIQRFESLTKKRGYINLPLPYEPVSLSLKIRTVKELDIAPEAIIDSSYKSVQQFITQNLSLPDAALKLNLTGFVKLRFVIEPSGLPSNIMVIEPLGGGCTEEAIRIVQMIRWKPGIKNSEAVRTCYNLSFKFDPANGIKSKHIPNQSNTGI